MEEYQIPGRLAIQDSKKRVKLVVLVDGI